MFNFIRFKFRVLLFGRACGATCESDIQVLVHKIDKSV